MASSAGQQLVAGRIPGERIATTEETSDSTTFTTTETVVLSVTAPVVAGRRYAVVVWCNFGSTVAGSGVDVRLYEDSLSGNLMNATIVHIETTSGVGFPCHIYAEYVADATENKTFVVGAAREYGTGTLHREGSSNNHSFLYVDYLSG